MISGAADDCDLGLRSRSLRWISGGAGLVASGNGSREMAASIAGVDVLATGAGRGPARPALGRVCSNPKGARATGRVCAVASVVADLIPPEDGGEGRAGRHGLAHPSGVTFSGNPEQDAEGDVGSIKVIRFLGTAPSVGVLFPLIPYLAAFRARSAAPLLAWYLSLARSTPPANGGAVSRRSGPASAAGSGSALPGLATSGVGTA